MTPEIAMYILGAAFVPILGWAISMSLWMWKIGHQIQFLCKSMPELLPVARKMDDLKEVISDNTKAMTELVTLIRILSDRFERHSHATESKVA